MGTCYSAPSRFLLRGSPDYSADAESEFHAEAHEQLRVKDLPRVPTRRLEVDSNPQPGWMSATTNADKLRCLGKHVGMRDRLTKIADIYNCL